MSGKGDGRGRERERGSCGSRSLNRSRVRGALVIRLEDGEMYSMSLRVERRTGIATIDVAPGIRVGMISSSARLALKNVSPAPEASIKVERYRLQEELNR